MICRPHDSPRAEQSKRIAQEACYVLDYEYAAVVLVELLGHGQPLAKEGIQGILIRLTKNLAYNPAELLEVVVQGLVR